MIKPELPNNEDERIRELESYDILGTAEHEDFDFLTAMASSICGTKISLISLLTEDKQWFLSHHGLESRETPKEYSFCAHAIHVPDEIFIVEDSRKDERFRDNPLVKGDPKVIFYAGCPMVSKNGYPIGTLCVIDDQPKTLSVKQIGLLKKLCRQAANLLEFRKTNLTQKSLKAELEQKNATLELAQEAHRIGAWKMDIKTGKTTWTKMVYEIHEVPHDFDHNKANGIEFYHPDYRSLISNAIKNALEQNKSFDVICKFITARGNEKWVRSTGKKVGDTLVGSFQDITDLKNSELKFKGIFNSSFSFIGFLNPDGVLLEANSTALEMADLKPEDVIGKKFWDCYWWQISEETRQELKSGIKRAAAGEEVAYEVPVWIANKTPLTILFSLKPVFDENGAVIYIIPEGRPIQEIVDTRNRYKAVIDGTQAGTFEWNIKTNDVLINERYAEMLGYSVDELKPVTFDKWLKNTHPEDVAEAQRRFLKCLENEESFFQLEMRLRHKSGSWIWVNVRGKVFEWSKDGKPLKMYGTHQDITTRKERELQVDYQKNILDALYELSPIGIALNDYETGQFIDVNQKLLEPTGYTKEEFLNLSYWDVTPKEYEPKESEALKQMNETGKYGPFEKEYIRNDGSRFPVVLKGVLIEDLNGQKLIWSFIQDVSKKKEAERKLHEAINRLESILDASTQVAIVATNTNGEISLFNSGAERLLGYSANEVVGKQNPAIFHLKEEIEQEAEEIFKKDQVRLSGFDIFVHYAKLGIPYTSEWTYIRKDGSRFPALLSVTAIYNGENISGFLGVAADISELKKAENEIRSLLDITKVQNDRLQNFAHIVSHNLRSHVGGITGILELIPLDYPEIAGNEYIELLQKGGENLKQTITDLTQVVKANLNESNFEKIELKRVVQKNIDSLKLQANESGVTISNLVADEIILTGIPAYIDSIVLNFITNAIKYSSEDRISFLKIHTNFDGKYLLLHFEDNGLGIDLKKHGDKLFGMYKTFHQHEDSRGVGLFITSNQVETMGGTIHVKSEVDVGTTFSIRLPSA